MTILVLKIWLVLSVVSVFLAVFRNDWGVVVIEDVNTIERNSPNVVKKIMLVLALFIIYAIRLPKTILVIIKQILR